MPRSGQKTLRRFVSWTTLPSASYASVSWPSRTRTERFRGERVFSARGLDFLGCCRIQEFQRGRFTTQTPSPRCQFSVAALRLVSRWQSVGGLLADIEFTGGPEVGESFCLISEVFQKQTEIVMSIGEIRITGEGFLIAVDRFSGTFEVFEQDAEIEVRGRLARCESCGGAVVRLGFA